MRITIKYQLYSIFLLITFLVGCWTVQTTSQDKKSETTSSPTQQSAEELKTIKGQVVRKDGWKIPMPTKKKLFESIVDTIASENGGAVKVTKNNYVPEEDFIFTDEPFTPEESRQVVSGSLKLLFIREFSVKGKVYSYKIGVRTAKPANPGDEIGFDYRFVDFDGDGKFETMLTDGDIELKVPAWAAK